MPQFPNGIALEENRVANDKRGALRRLQEIEPDGSCNETEGEPREPGDERGGKSRRGEEGECRERNSVHGQPHPFRRAPGDRATLGHEAAEGWLPGPWQHWDDGLGAVKDQAVAVAPMHATTLW